MFSGLKGRHEPIVKRAGVILGAAVVSVALLSVFTSLEVQVAKARTGLPAGVTGVNWHSVNRALKGDRIPSLPASRSVKPPVSGQTDPKLPDGCVATFGAARNIFWTEVPGRCVG
ncbi:MAG: hypothetical protein QOF91_3321 [Alphaproteobacteria bacterium]|jgi:hypothetical protein|nr:hypothetical protein [Alphaproteobacteria bacterium]